MRIVMHAENDLEVSDFLAPEMSIEAHGEDLAYSALQMFATSMALCSFSVLFAYGESHDFSPEAIRVRMRWSYASGVNRIAEIAMDIHWPGLPVSRRAAAERAASLCTLHRTLETPPIITTRLDV